MTPATILGMLVADHVIPDSELSWTFSPSGGPGGQHANRSNTRAEVRFDLARSPSIPEPLKEHMLRRLGKRAVDGVVIVTADETRSQTPEPSDRSRAPGGHPQRGRPSTPPAAADPTHRFVAGAATRAEEATERGQEGQKW